MPLFHDVDYRVAAPGVRGAQLRSTAPYVNYSEIGKAEAPRGPPAADRAGGGVLHVPIAGSFPSLDPSLTDTLEQTECLTSIFETLTWAQDGVAGDAVARLRDPRRERRPRGSVSACAPTSASTTAGG